MGFRSTTMGLRGRRLSWAVAAAALQGFLLLGYDQGVMSGLIGVDTNAFGQQFNEPDANMQGIITSIYDIGCAAGCLFCFFYGELFGRKVMIISGGSIMIIGTIFLGASYGIPQLLVGRIVTGVGNGINSSTVPAYQAEFAKPEHRGKLLCAQGTVTIVGLCIAYWLDYGLSFVDGGVQWRFPISFQAFFAIFLVLQMLPLPESPRWLVEKGRISEASHIIAALKDADEDDEEVVLLRRQIETSIEIESAGGPFRYSELFTGGKLQNGRRLILCGMCNMMQQFTGSNMINYYAPTVYQNAMGLTRNLSLILGGCTSLTYLLGSAIPLFVVDRFGRRALLIASAGGLCLCFAMAAILLSLGTTGGAYGATAFVFLFQIFMGFGWLPMPWFYPSEVTTTRIRSRGQAFGGFINWMCVFTVVQITPIAIQNINWRTFIIFAVLCFCWMPIVYCFFPETSRLQLEDIDHLFEKGGITGGVFKAKGGRTVEPGYHASHPNMEGVEKSAEEAVGMEKLSARSLDEGM
ncbi:general substrate transporter [Hortaea werneckii]|uniref:Major facilitator superfamily (MFS) profile domain-containing protein n=1 Tax=Hortaea werneckii TaxID=91943 RepID=A0A3M7GR56_HORWE|nr:general substrate transporter [Hortaea werneckii]KAI6869805.1 general substrate transporter [Hortaea werneckii]KAI7346731.1 general substrate transporter [Hortaea werneckii]RMZ03543.1 hypothetical protein D0862_05607 [Hortaea werneckii]